MEKLFSSFVYSNPLMLGNICDIIKLLGVVCKLKIYCIFFLLLLLLLLLLKVMSLYMTWCQSLNYCTVP